MSVRYPALGKTKRSAWGLTVKKGPWKESLRDKTYQVNSQKHAGHGDWYTVERPNYNNTQGGDPDLAPPNAAIPKVVTSGIKYKSSEFIPKTRPGRLQRSYLTERQQKQTLTSQPAGLGPPVAEVAQGFRLGSGDDAPRTPPPSYGGASTPSSGSFHTASDWGSGDSIYTPTTGSFHSEYQRLYPSPVSDYNPNLDLDPDHDAIDDLAPPNNVVQSPWQPALENILSSEEHGLVATEDNVMHAAEAAGEESGEFEKMAEYIISQHPGSGDLIDEYLKRLLEKEGIEGVREEYEILKAQGGGAPEPVGGPTPTLAGGGPEPEVNGGDGAEGSGEDVG